MIKKLLIGAATICIAGPASAYVTGNYGDHGTDANQRTHILVVARGKDLATQLQETAAAKAKKIQELYPNDQIYLVGVNETKSKDNLELLRQYGFKNVVENKRVKLSVEQLLVEMGKFNKIASVNVYSHSTAYYGVMLEGSLKRMDPKADGYEKLKGKFTSDAYGFLHGCNSGQLLAPVLSRSWGIPVAGSFTSTGFQRTYENNKDFYFADARAPKDGVLSVNNTISFDRGQSCLAGSCVRLHPDNFGYIGYWGDFKGGGLGFFKFFCVNNDQATCDKAMARSALTHLSVKPLKANSSYEDYLNTVYDIMCPISAYRDVRQKCIEGLNKAVAEGTTYDSYDGKSLQCDFKGCKAKFKCQRIAKVDLLKEKSCEIINLREDTKTTTQVEEFKAYLRGYQLLNGRLQ